jgi:hypothetical protein
VKADAKDFKIIGKPFRKVDARAKCVGQTKFADDIVLPRMLFCKILRSHYLAFLLLLQEKTSRFRMASCL